MKLLNHPKSEPKSFHASGRNNTNSQTKTKTTMLKLRLCNYSDAYIHNKGAIKTTDEGADAPAIKVYERNK